MSNGIRISQAGVSVPYAADYQFVFNSDWPSLQIAFEAVITVGAGATGQIAHNLGFFPMTMTWFLVNNVSVGRFYAVTTFDKTTVYINNSGNSSPVIASIKCYNLDITQSRDYTLPRFPILKTVYDPTVGIKVCKYGKSIDSIDLRDFILHSRAQSPAILSVLTQANGVIGGGINSIQYINPAGYAPWVLGFISPSGNNSVYQCFPPGGNQAAPAFFQFSGVANIWTSGINGNGTLVVLRDPLVVSNTLRVIY